MAAMKSSRVSHQLMGLLSLETPRPEDGVSRATNCSHPAWGKHNASSPAVVSRASDGVDVISFLETVL